MNKQTNKMTTNKRANEWAATPKIIKGATSGILLFIIFGYQLYARADRLSVCTLCHLPSQLLYIASVRELPWR